MLINVPMRRQTMSGEMTTMLAEQSRLGRARVMPWIRRLIFYLILLSIWEGIVRLEIWPPYLFPGPLIVANALWEGVTQGLFLPAALVSLRRLAIGYSISLSLGLVLGLLLGRNKLIQETVGSLVLGMQALPSVCWLPLAILWFGLNERAIIFVVVLGALFSITLGVEAGVKNTPPVYLKAARNLGARGVRLYTQVLLPAALPAILNGLKQGWSFAWRSLMAGELLYYTLSLGNLLQTGRDLNDAAQVMAVMVMIVIVGVTIDQILFAPVERRVRERWGLA
ncbi:ABC transporter permease [Candidatus Chloroploca sp. M-50]|uniref:ABC transporter permease n=2 Tax=Candidatus Chloroploca mongolica TaxID=2528176 RepID=A0ABS4DAZ6_9CHLR|nr:ABC transporter permease [Candidatus Chloroploca mongolica]